MAVAKSRITISKPRPEFGKQILQERRPFLYTLADADDDDDWFVLLDLAPKVSGICLYSPVCCFAKVFFAPRFCRLMKGYAKVTLCQSVSADGSVHSFLVHGLTTFFSLRLEA